MPWCHRTASPTKVTCSFINDENGVRPWESPACCYQSPGPQWCGLHMATPVWGSTPIASAQYSLALAQVPKLLKAHHHPLQTSSFHHEGPLQPLFSTWQSSGPLQSQSQQPLSRSLTPVITSLSRWQCLQLPEASQSEMGGIISTHIMIGLYTRISGAQHFPITDSRPFL